MGDKELIVKDNANKTPEQLKAEEEAKKLIEAQVLMKKDRDRREVLCQAEYQQLVQMLQQKYNCTINPVQAKALPAECLTMLISAK